MPKIHVERTIDIDASVDHVRAATQDFTVWPSWSPWLITEPDAQLNYQGTAGQPGHGYSWNGKLVGSGSMEIDSIQGGLQKMDLQFLRPFKSKAKVSLRLDAENEATKVTWSMDSSLPFFMFFLSGMMKTMIGMDYERGLKMLKAYCEQGRVDSRIEFVGTVDIPTCQFVGYRTSTSMQEIGESMSTTLCKVAEEAKRLGLSATESKIGAIYNKMDMKKGNCDYTAMVPVSDPLENIRPAEEFTCGSIGGYKALKVIHYGAYEFLGNGWSSGFAYQRAKKLKMLKKQPPFEFYIDDPESTAVDQLRTEIYLPLRG